VTDFIQKLEKIELPNQLVAVIGDPLLQNLLQLKSNNTIKRRIDNWLTAFFEDQLESGGSTGNTLLDMLAAIKEYASFTKVHDTAHSPYYHSPFLSNHRHFHQLARNICNHYWENGTV
jgi:centromere protein I